MIPSSEWFCSGGWLDAEDAGGTSRLDEPGHPGYADSQTSNTRFPFAKWFANNVPAQSMAFQTAHQAIAEQALLLGVGIGFYPLHEARKRTDLIEVVAHQDDWQVPLWLVTHVDMHRTAKVHGFLNVLKEQRENQ